MSKGVRIAILADIHLDRSPTDQTPSSRLTDLADILLLRAVKRLNLLAQPDVVLLPGDLHNSGCSSDVSSEYQELRSILDLLKCPWAAIPGNHDSKAELFYKSFPDPGPHMDVSGVRFAFFDDPEMPGYNAVRTAEGLSRMDHLRDDGWAGPIAMMQHVPLFPPGSSNCPYSYLNAEEIIASMRRNRIGLAVAGHYHEGFDHVRDGALSFVAAPALCEIPFSYLLLELEPSGELTVSRESLAMPPQLKLQDIHVHTNLAYCSENMDIAKSLRLAKVFGLDAICFTEHSGHLYFDSKSYGSKACLEASAKPVPADRRMERYFKMLDDAQIPFSRRGLEIDCRFDGSPLVEPADLGKVSLRIGAVHAMRSLKEPNSKVSDCVDEFLRLNEGIISSGIDILAHPFRVFTRAKREAPQELFHPLAKMLRKHGVAAEINFHTNNPPPEFLRLCIDEGVKTAFGSDAHNLYEVGEFAPHLKLLRDAGFKGEISDIMFSVPPIA